MSTKTFKNFYRYVKRKIEYSEETMSDSNNTKQVQSVLSREFIAIEPKYLEWFPKIYFIGEYQE